MNLARTDGLGERDLANRRDPIDEFAHQLIFGRALASAEFVVELAAVVVGRVVAGSHVEPAVSPQEADGEGKLRRRDVALLSGGRMCEWMPLAA